MTSTELVDEAHRKLSKEFQDLALDRLILYLRGVEKLSFNQILEKIRKHNVFHISSKQAVFERYKAACRRAEHTDL